MMNVGVPAILGCNIKLNGFNNEPPHIYHDSLPHIVNTLHIADNGSQLIDDSSLHYWSPSTSKYGPHITAHIVPGVIKQSLAKTT